MIYSCDFETTTKEPVYVWLAGKYNIETGDFNYFYNIDNFMENILKESSTIIFHNLAFDGIFVVTWLYKHGLKLDQDKKLDNSFSTLITEFGQWYKIEIKYNSNKIKIIDSMKLIPLSVEQIGKTFLNSELEKETIDYKKNRGIGYKATDDEIHYLFLDCKIVAEAYLFFKRQGMTKLTLASNALQSYKDLIGENNFKTMYPELEIDIDISLRNCYKGGFCYLNPKYKDKIIKEGIVLDVNSMYPYIMYDKLLPYGLPIYFEGKYTDNDEYPLYIQQIACKFKLKDGYIPTIQLKHTLRYAQNEYVTDTRGEEEILMLTNIDLEIFLKHYNVYDIEYMGGYMFRGQEGQFKKYIDYWIEVKSSNKGKNSGMYMIAKWMLNSLYGKFGTNPVKQQKIPILKNGIIVYEKLEPTIEKGIYLPLAIFVTSWGRYICQNMAQKYYNTYIYSDTDSVHLEIFPNGLNDNENIDSTKLGAWDIEFIITKGKYIRQKCYLLSGYSEPRIKRLKMAIAGLPKKSKKYVNFDNFKEGTEYTGKLLPKRVEGGVILQETTFRIG